MGTVTSKTVMFVTGAFVSHYGWDEWQKYFQSKGYKTSAPPWPYKDGTPAELRKRQPNDTSLAYLPLKDIINNYEKIIKSLDEKPIIIGHSTGGLITQILLNRDLADAAVAIHSLPPLGVIPYEFSFLRGGWRSLGFFTPVKKTYLMSFKKWQYAFTNGMPLEEQKKAYEENIIPESKTMARSALTPQAKVDFKKKHAPLLFTAGTIDNIIPASLNYRNYKKYKNGNGSVTDYKNFEGRNHFVLGQPTWKEDADYILDWIDKQRAA